jgi:hypothetical protein
MDMASRGRIRGGEKGTGLESGLESRRRWREMCRARGERNEVAKVGKLSRQAAASRKKE